MQAELQCGVVLFYEYVVSIIRDVRRRPEILGCFGKSQKEVFVLVGKPKSYFFYPKLDFNRQKTFNFL